MNYENKAKEAAEIGLQ